MTKFWSWVMTAVVAVASGAIGFLGSQHLGIPGAWPVVIAVGSFVFTTVYLGMYLIGNDPTTSLDHNEEPTDDLP